MMSTASALTTTPPARRARDAILSVLLCAAMIASTLVALAQPADAVSDTDFEVTTHDLEFILQQIGISEAHAEAEANDYTGDFSTYSLLCPDDPFDEADDYDPQDYHPHTDEPLDCVPHPRLPWGLRTVTGEHNNLFDGREHFGAGGFDFPRLVDPNFVDADEIMTEAYGEGRPEGTISSYKQTDGYVYDADPRLVSNLIVDQTVSNPAAVAAANNTSDFGGSVDGAELTQEVVVLEEEDPALDYSNAGETRIIELSAEGGSALVIDDPDAYVEFTVEDGFQWFGVTGTHLGYADIFINGVFEERVDQYNSSRQPGPVFEIGGLEGTNRVRIENTGEANPDAQAARTAIDSIHTYSTALEGGTGNVIIPDVAPDEGLSAPFTGWLTMFGQFFDHGLDQVEKGGNGTVIMPLRADDPLREHPGYNSRMPYITLERATQYPDGDEVIQHRNRTTPFVDQNQTYGSHPAHNVFLRKYEWKAGTGVGDVPGVPVPTGELLEGAEGGLVTWAETKAHVADYLGIQLDDNDVHAVPSVKVDPYGRFVAGDNGLPQLILNEDGDLREGDLETPVPTDGLGISNQAFLDDIAHAAVPGKRATHDTRDYTGAAVAAGQVIPHDADLLGDHYLAGDGRANENIALTSVHHVFHSEHNRLVEHIEEVLATDTDLLAAYEREEGRYWDYGERLYQAARFVTEMEYQHLVFEEYARSISPEIDVQPLNETAYHDNLDASIKAEFAHVTYRFGHSMLRETVDRVGFGTDDSVPLLEAFLSPSTFTNDGALTPNKAAGAVIQGMTRQTGNGIDEFVTDTLRNNLLGVPLDLAAINMARARDTGSPTLQEARAQFYADTPDGGLKPYANWNEFRLGMKHRASIVNFVAAYGIDDTLDDRDTMTIDELRAAARVLVTDDPATSDFMNAPAAQTGLNNVDFWIGGLAERLSVFGGFLGTTFNYVFERQLESLQNGDRFYYLNRNQGLNLFHQLENNSFSELIMRNTDATLLHANVFANPNVVYDLSLLYDENCVLDGELPEGLTLVDGAIRYDGGEHVVIHGSECDEGITGDLGDDSIWGHDGEDRIRGGQGDDTLHGGRGDDTIQDDFGVDTVHGGEGNDAINVGSGADLFFGGPGSDFLLHGTGPTTSFAGSGNDFVHGGSDSLNILTGNEGDDWLESGLGHDLLQGDNALTFQNDPVGGNDILMGGPGNDDHDAEGGDDIMLNEGIDRHAGMLGFDWVSHQNDPNPVHADLDVFLYQPHSITLMNSRYFSIEALSGWNGDDVLRGASSRKDQPFADGAGNELSQDHIDRIDGLGGLLEENAARFIQTNESHNILLGGEGSDMIEGRAGDDYIDGGSWLNVGIEWDNSDGDTQRLGSMLGFQQRVFSGTIDPAHLRIFREIVAPGEDEEACDTAVYQAERDEYTITDNGDGTWTVGHVNGPDPIDDDGTEELDRLNDGSDTLRNIDRLKFADGFHQLTGMCDNAAPTGTISFDTEIPMVGEQITAIVDIQDEDGLGDLHFEWQYEGPDGWATANNDGTDTFTPGEEELGFHLRVIVTYTDGAETLESVTSDPTVNPVAEEVTAPAAALELDLTGDATVEDGTPALYTAETVNNGDAGITEEVDVVREVRDTEGALVTDAVVEWDELGTWTPIEFTVGAGTANEIGTDFDNTGQWRVDYPGSGDYTFTLSFIGVDTSTVYATDTVATTVTTTGAEGGGNEQNTDEPDVDVLPSVFDFEDVPADHTFADFISILVETGVTSGCSTEPREYCPSRDVTRGEMATFIANAFEANGDALALPADTNEWPEFGDVDVDDTHAEGIARLVLADIANGYANGDFGAGNPVTRAQMATFLANALNLPEPTEADGANPFTDLNEGSGHNDAIHRIKIAGITDGRTATEYDPDGYVTRGEMAKFLVIAFELDALV